MDTSVWISFLIVAMATAISPGPAIMLTISNSMSFGSRKAFWTALGNSIGLLFVSTFVMLGLGIILKTSATLFLIFKFIGALYLIFIGIKHFNNRNTGFIQGQKINNLQSITNTKLFGQGILIALTNPKAIIFFFGLFPLFIIKKAPLLQQFIILTVTFSICALISHIIYLTLFDQIKTWFSSLCRIKWFNRIIGSMFIFMGLGVFFLKRN